MTCVMNHRNWLVIAVLAMLAVQPCVAADKADKAGKDQAQARRLQQQLRAIEQEKAQLAQQLAQQKTDAENQVKQVQGKTVETQRRADALAGRNLTLSRELETAKARNEALRADKEAADVTNKTNYAALAAKLAEAERRLADQRLAYESEKQQMEAAFSKSNVAMSACRARNESLYKLGNELLTKYEKKSCFSSVLQAEPFTGLKRAQVEKGIEEYREKLDKDQLLPSQGAEGAPAAR